MPRPLLFCALLAGVFLGTTVAVAQQKKGKKTLDPSDSDANGSEKKAPEKKAPPLKIVLDGLTYQVLANSEDSAGVAYVGGRIIRKWSEDAGGWTVSSFTWTYSVPKETPSIRVFIPALVDGKATVTVDEREVWSVDRKGLVAKRDRSPPLETPGANGLPSQVVIRVKGSVSNVLLLVPAKDSGQNSAKGDGKDDESATKATQLLAKAKEAIDAKNVSLARVRLKLIVSEYSRTPAAEEARVLLKRLEK
jgi:hypothetical protein